VLFLLAYLGGVLTILSPCILPVIPFVFARVDQPFRKTGLPLLIGMTATFALVAAVVSAGGPWLVRANEYGRFAALALFFVLGIMLILPVFTDRLTRPLVAFGNKLSSRVPSRSGVVGSAVLGVATGLLWAPCAGPILGLILTGAAIQGATFRTWMLLLAYAAGAGTSLATALLAGEKAFAMLKRFLLVERWIRPAIGVTVLIAVISVAFGWDRGILTRLSIASTTGFEQGLLRSLHSAETTHAPGLTNGSGDAEPSFEDATTWINSAPLQLSQLRGKVVLVDFWTYSCINCLRSIPYVNAWAEKYRNSGLVVIGVHTPEFAFEKDAANVQGAVRELGISYPVAMDNDYDIWTSFDNDSWPADYLIDIHGKIRHRHVGEGAEEQSERWIQELLAERPGETSLPEGTVKVQAKGIQAAPDGSQIHSRETYLGYGRTQHFASPNGLIRDKSTTYYFPPLLELNQWALSGRWLVQDEVVSNSSQTAAIRFRFHARDLHLVLGTITGRGTQFEVTLDGHNPGEDHGVDTDGAGRGMVRDHRLYQLIRQKGQIKDHLFEIRFFGADTQAFAFTFG